VAGAKQSPRGIGEFCKDNAKALKALAREFVQLSPVDRWQLTPNQVSWPPECWSVSASGGRHPRQSARRTPRRDIRRQIAQSPNRPLRLQPARPSACTVKSQSKGISYGT